MTYTRSPEASQRDALQREIAALRAQLETEMGRLRDAQEQRGQAQKQAKRAAAKLERIHTEHATIAAIVDDAKQEAATIIRDAKRDANRMRTAAHRYLERKQETRPNSGLLKVLVNERYGT